MLGVRVVIAESFERIHRSNLIGMWILPLEFAPGVTRKTLGLTGEERISRAGLQALMPGAAVDVTLTDSQGYAQVIQTRCRIDTRNELTYYQHGGICTTSFARCCDGQWAEISGPSGPDSNVSVLLIAASRYRHTLTRREIQHMAHFGCFRCQIALIFRVASHD